MRTSDEWRLRKPRGGEWAFIAGLFMASIPAWTWAARSLWRWYVWPVFGVDVPTAGQILGLSILVGLFHATPSKEEQTRSMDEWFSWALSQFLVPLFSLAIGGAICVIFC